MPAYLRCSPMPSCQPLITFSRFISAYRPRQMPAYAYQDNMTHTPSYYIIAVIYRARPRQPRRDEKERLSRSAPYAVSRHSSTTGGLFQACHCTVARTSGFRLRAAHQRAARATRIAGSSTPPKRRAEASDAAITTRHDHSRASPIAPHDAFDFASQLLLQPLGHIGRGRDVRRQLAFIIIYRALQSRR